MVVELDQLTDIKALSEGMDFVGFGMVTGQEYNFCLPFMRQVKAMGIPVLVGGVYVRRGAYIDPGAVDYVCRGEGEILSDFILDGKTDVFDRPYLHENLDDLPMIDYTRFTGYEFDREIPFLKGIRILPYHSSRGCPYQCSFCEVKFQSRKVRIKSLIRKDLTYLQEAFKPDLFHIMDELIPYYNEVWCAEIEDAQVPFMAYIRADISAEKLHFLIQNGLRVAIFGVESGDEKYRNEILKKNLLDDDIYRTVGMLKAYGIYYVHFYMVGGPYETPGIKAKTLGMARGLEGFPIIWQYEDLSKRVFSVDDETLDRYSKKVKGSQAVIQNNMNDSSNYVETGGGGFLVYRLMEDGLLIKEICGSGKYWDLRLKELCKENGKPRFVGKIGRNLMPFQRKYGLHSYGQLVGKEI